MIDSFGDLTRDRKKSAIEPILKDPIDFSPKN